MTPPRTAAADDRPRSAGRAQERPVGDQHRGRNRKARSRRFHFEARRRCLFPRAGGGRRETASGSCAGPAAPSPAISPAIPMTAMAWTAAASGEGFDGGEGAGQGRGRAAQARDARHEGMAVGHADHGVPADDDVDRAADADRAAEFGRAGRGPPRGRLRRRGRLSTPLVSRSAWNRARISEALPRRTAGRASSRRSAGGFGPEDGWRRRRPDRGRWECPAAGPRPPLCASIRSRPR